jgi:hypothetical protein
MPPWSDRRGLRSVVLWVVLWVVLAAVVPGASADVLPLQAIETEQRLRENPQAFDRADQFCSGRSVGDACRMLGTALAGGGAGICRNGIDSSRTRIDLRCERTAKASLARGLPSEGFVLPAYFCENPEGAAIARSRGFSCTPAAQPPHDRFCQGREIGAACTALLTVDGTPVRDAGVCARITESAPRFYFRGWHIAQREVVNCVSPKPIERRYKEVSGWQKVRQ